MDKEYFGKQMDRLKETWGEDRFPPNRVELLWEKVKALPNEKMERLAAHFILNCRYAPMEKDWNDALDKLHREDQERRRNPGGAENPLSVLEKLKTSDPDFKRMCMKHLRSFLKGEMSRDRFLDGCDHLDKIALHIMREKGQATCRNCAGSGYSLKLGHLERCHCLFGRRTPDRLEFRSGAHSPPQSPYKQEKFETT